MDYLQETFNCLLIELGDNITEFGGQGKDFRYQRKTLALFILAYPDLLTEFCIIIHALAFRVPSQAVPLFFDFSQPTSLDLIFCRLHLLVLFAGLENMDDFLSKIFSIAVACSHGFFYNTPIAGFGKVPKGGSQFGKNVCKSKKISHQVRQNSDLCRSGSENFPVRQ
jgi:hypothetical protein